MRPPSFQTSYRLGTRLRCLTMRFPPSSKVEVGEASLATDGSVDAVEQPVLSDPLVAPVFQPALATRLPRGSYHARGREVGERRGDGRVRRRVRGALRRMTPREMSCYLGRNRRGRCSIHLAGNAAPDRLGRSAGIVGSCFWDCPAGSSRLVPRPVRAAGKSW